MKEEEQAGKNKVGNGHLKQRNFDTSDIQFLEGARNNVEVDDSFIIYFFNTFSFFFNFYLFICLFIYGCVGSSFLCEGFL